MAGEYKFNSASQKLSQVKLMENEYYDEQSGTTMRQVWSKNMATSSSKTFKIMVAMQILIALLLLALLILSAFNTYLAINEDPSTVECNNNNDATGSVMSILSEQCNSSSVLQTILKNTQLIPQMMNNSEITKLLQVMQDDLEVITENTIDISGLVSNKSDQCMLKLMEIITTLTNHKELTINTAAIVEDILIIAEELLRLQNASSLLNSATFVSCADIKKAIPTSTTGYYHVNSRSIYCYMDELCGSNEGWTRLAYFDMDDSTESCPSGYKQYTKNGVRACGRPYTPTGSCTPGIDIDSKSISYTEVCGRLIGYQIGSPSAVSTTHKNNLNSYYVDGISITRGSPREHVWTFMAGIQDSYYDPNNCPCNEPPGGNEQVQEFIGDNYFCESGNPNNYYVGSSGFYTSDPLWDGAGCGGQEHTCAPCTSDSTPWFYRKFENASTESFEIRMCADQDTSCEDIPFSYYEIYTK